MSSKTQKRLEKLCGKPKSKTAPPLVGRGFNLNIVSDLNPNGLECNPDTRGLRGEVVVFGDVVPYCSNSGCKKASECLYYQA